MKDYRQLREEYIRYLLQQCAFIDSSLRPTLIAASKQALRHGLVSAKLAVWLLAYGLSPALYRKLLAKRVPEAAVLGI